MCWISVPLISERIIPHGRVTAFGDTRHFEHPQYILKTKYFQANTVNLRYNFKMSIQNNTYTSKFLPVEVEKFKAVFENENAKFSTPQYMYFQARGDGYTASFYTSGKLVIQGNKTAEIVSKYFESVQNPLFDTENSMPASKNQCTGDIAPYPHIGIDESGKGDFFGPLVIAGAYLDEKGANALSKAGVCDSKKLDDKKILELEILIKEAAIFDIIAISPLKYNELYAKFKNLNKLLAWGHSTVLENILAKKPCEIAISDKFADERVIQSALKERGKSIRLIQQTKAEADTAVAAASILARAEFVKRISNLSKEYGINLPKGASNLVLEQGQKFAEKYGRGELKNVSKLHFKTYSSIV